jgi:tetratricopeptide (TPR) repeat protein
MLLLPIAVAAQKKEPPTKPEPPITITLPTDAKWQRRIEVAADYAQEKDWPRAVMILQNALDATDDFPIEVKRRDKDGKALTIRTTARAEAERMIRAFPIDGLEYYRSRYNQTAADLLKVAKSKESPELFGFVVRRYFNTTSGPEALERLASASVNAGHPALAAFLGNGPESDAKGQPDAGRLLDAALALERLLEQPAGLEKWDQARLLQAAVAFQAVGDRTRAQKLWRQYAIKTGKEGLRATRPGRRPEEIHARFLEAQSWPMFGGDSSRSGQIKGDMPFMEKVWEQSLFGDESKGQAQDRIKKAVEMLEDRKQPAISAFSPIAASTSVPGKGHKSLVLYRSHWGIQAVDVKTGRLMWDADCKWSLEAMYEAPRTHQAIENWKQQYNQIARQNIVLENSVIGSLSTDGRLIYTVDDFPVPPLPPAHFPIDSSGKPQLPSDQEIYDAIHHNTLDAYYLGSGKLHWRLGGHGDKKGHNDPNGELYDSYFLGPPLPQGNRLYAMHEKQSELRLAVLEPRRGTVEHIVPLAKLRDSLLEDPFRRSHAAPVAYGDGILVCPTNAGGVVGVDLQSLNVAWGYVYPSEVQPPVDQPVFDFRFGPRDVPGWRAGGRDTFFKEPRLPRAPAQDDWKLTAPVVVGGKVVFTPPDAPTIHCLNLKDGSLVWKATKKSGDVYLAGVYDDNVLIVGKDSCRALGLADGKEVWSLATGLPSGRGIAGDTLYYLPLKSAATTREPEVCVIDITKGKVITHVQARKNIDGKTDVPGNLLFFEGRLLSLTPTRILAYPVVATKLKAIDEAIQKNPRDPVALIERGRMHYDRGDLSKAVEDLRSALANNPTPELRERARLFLFETLTAILQKDFDAREKDLKEYEELCHVPRLTNNQTTYEERRRRGIYLLVVGHGYEKQGKPVEALRAYLDFAAQARPEQLMPSPEDPAVNVAPDAWARGQIQGLLKRATPEQRKRLEEEIEKERN